MKTISRLSLIVALALLTTSCGSKLRSIVFTSESVTIAVGDTYQMSVQATPEDAEFEATWSSSNPDVASIDAKGLVVAKTIGTCTVTINADGKTATCDIIVVEGEPMPGADVNVTDYGAINSYFSISESKQVQFSRGNLQYQASSGTWRFASTQWLCRGLENQYISATTDRWIDLFGWATSGGASGAVANQPYSTDADDSHYIVGDNIENGIIGPNARGDWGRTNHIQDYESRSGYWRVLTAAEWQYLVGDDGARANRWGLGTINGVFRGVVLIPDQWTPPMSDCFTSRAPYGYNTNKYTYREWMLMQESGAVFLPAGGVRNGQEVSNVNVDGFYWSATADGNAAKVLSVGNDLISASGSRYRHLGLSVRLVMDRF
ncbi:MAG: Ig-like domain-containing protein [Bacteroidales bacterium]|nr:Ig-like domain-containing protein [Bacteroidales bacterium]